MGRELKFRAWDGNVMHSVDELHFPQGGVKWYGPGMGQGWAKDYPVMQFPGLKDRNGAEIWEGDLLRVEFDDDTPKPLREVKFVDGAFVAAVVGNYGEARPWPLRLAITLNGEVIGNVFSNPELLERP